MLFSVVPRPSDGTTVVLHNKRWQTSFLSSNITFIGNLSSLPLTPLKFIK